MGNQSNERAARPSTSTQKLRNTTPIFHRFQTAPCHPSLHILIEIESREVCDFIF